MSTKTSIMSSNINRCGFNFDGIEVEVKKMGPDQFKINIDPGLDLTYEKLPSEYKSSGLPRIEGAAPGFKEYRWFVPHYSGSGDLHFNNGNVFTLFQINHILFNIQEGAKKLKEIAEDKKIRINIDSTCPITEFEWHGVEIEVERQCNHLGTCDNHCKYSISINSGIEFDMPDEVRLRSTNSPGFRAEFENTSSFTMFGEGLYNLTRHIKGESGDTVLFKNGDVFSKKKLEYMLFSIKKTLDKYNDLGYKLKKKEVKSEEPNNKSETMKIILVPINDILKVELKIEGMMSLYEISDEYFASEGWVCYCYPDGGFVIKHGKEYMRFSELNTNQLNVNGTILSIGTAYKVLEMLSKCASNLYIINHPNFNGMIARI